MLAAGQMKTKELSLQHAAVCGVPSSVQDAPCGAPVPCCGWDGWHRQTAGGLGMDVPFREEDKEKAGLLPVKWG